jgi:hypothetical protein
MSNSDTQSVPARTFNVRVVNHTGNLSHDTQITVYDGRGEIRYEALGSVQTQLPKGLYTVRMERSGEMVEQVIRHETGTDTQIDEPLRQSSVPVFDTATTHEYYAYTSMDWSKKDTRPPLGMPELGTESRVFIFLRTISSEHYHGENLAEDLYLLDLNGQVLSDFGPGEVEHNQRDGWLTLSAEAQPGSYLLRYDRSQPREMPLYVFRNVNSQVFITYHHGLRFETASILLPYTSRSFEPDDRHAAAADAALAGLQRGENVLPREMMSDLLAGKFENPMLGLLGAHFLLLQREANPNTVQIVLGNLGSLIGDAPDVQALKLGANARFGMDYQVPPFDQPPMLRAGLELVLRHSSDDPALVPTGSLFERIAARYYVDSPWSSWEPVIRIEHASNDNKVLPRNTSFDIQETESEPQWVKAYLNDLARGQRRSESRRSFDVKQVASDVNLPVSIIERAYAELGGEDLWIQEGPGGDDLTRIGGIGRVFEAVLKRAGFHTYADLAGADDADIERIQTGLGRFAYRPIDEDWFGQARRLVEG